MIDILETIYSLVSEGTDIETYKDLKDYCRECMKTDIPLAIKYLKKLSDRLEEVIPTIQNLDEMKKMYSLHKKVLLTAAPHDFESYILYIESNRDPEKKFYPPRRAALRPVIIALQEMADDKLDLLAVSLPPGCGKTTVAIFYLTWLAGRIPDEPMLTGSHSNSFVRGVYDECLRIMDKNGDYLWHDVFPLVSVVNTNAKDCRIDLGKRKRFETLEFTSIGTGNAGLYRAATLLYCDDLVSGIEVALSKERLDKLWETYTTDLRQRKIGDKCKELHIATRWSVHDVIGRLENQYGDSDRAKFIAVPAMNEQDESNFDYAYGVGFNTNFYKEQRDIMDDVSWKALYMNQPIERDGILYQEDELRRYFELPEGTPDSIISVCDTKDRGTDYCCMPIAYQYGQNFFIEDILCDNSKPEIVDARLVEILMKNKVQLSRFESNSAGGRVAQTVQSEVKKKGGITHITTKFTTSNKETKIIVNSPFVKEHFLFKDNSVIQSREYKKALDMLCSYTMAGKNKHDDVPDAMSQLAEFAQSFTLGKVEVFKRPW
jgi:predicted phage terminase large subunit-like protein